MVQLTRLAPILLVALAGCPTDPGRQTGPKQPGGPQVRAYTDSVPVTALLAIHGYLITGGPAGMDRFDLRTGARVHVGAAAGLPDDEVVAIVRDELADEAWIATNRGLARYDPARDIMTALPPPSDAQGASASGIRAIAADPEGGLWVGGPAGLFHVSRQGAWKPGGFTRPVRALHAGADGQLWIGTSEGLVDRRADGSYAMIGSDEGCAVTSIDAVFSGPDGGPVVLGTDDQQRSRIAFLVGTSFTTFKPSPEVKFVAGARRMDDVVLATADRLYSLSPPRAGARALRRDGLHLVAVAGPNRRSPYVIKPLDLALPTEITALAAASDDLYVGTRTVGTARYETGAAKKGARWLRRRDLVEGARDFSVACASMRECYVATGTNRAWRYDGQHFATVSIASDPETVVLAMVRSPEGAILALYREPEERRMHVGRLVAGGGFVTVAAIAVETPGGASALSFAEFSPDGTLWLGLNYLDDEGESRPYGVAVVDLSLNLVTYHHEQRGNDSRKTGILPLPNDVADIDFLSDEQGNVEVWFATTSGAARLQGDKVTVYTEAEGLDSEILHGIVATPGGVVFVASSSGVGEYDGSRWSWPRSLAVDARTLALGKDGRLWLGTDRGLAIFDGRRVQRVNVRAGQFSGAVENLIVDHLGRLWARSGQGIAIVTP